MAPITPEIRTGRWKPEEHAAFVKGLAQHGRQWKKIQTMVPTRTLVQIRTHAQKYFLKLEKEKKATDGTGEHKDTPATPATAPAARDNAG